MRKSLQKTPPSGPSSRPRPCPPRCWPPARGAPAAKRDGRDRYRTCRARESRSRRSSTPIGWRRVCGCSKGFSAGRELADCAQLRAAVAGDDRSASRRRSAWCGRPDETVAVRRRHLRPGRSGGLALRGLARRLGQSARHRAREPHGRAFFPAAHSAADRRRRPSTPFEDAAFHVMPLGVPGATEDAFGLLLVGGDAPLSPGPPLVHHGLRPEARSDPAPAGAGRRRPQAGARARAALQHHQRRHRPDSADRHRRPAAHRQRARADALHRVRGGERGPARRRAAEQHAAVVGALEQGDRGDRRGAARAAAGEPGRRLGPAVRAAEHGHRGPAPGHRRRLDSAQRHRPAPRQRGDRGELPASCASPRRRRAPRATA